MRPRMLGVEQIHARGMSGIALLIANTRVLLR
jgi:hypothetical protein